jgi:hypothetical protein
VDDERSVDDAHHRLAEAGPGPESGLPESFRLHFRHKTASPGYYAVTLDDYKIRAELTTTTRAGFQRFTFPNADQARILMVLDVPGEYGTVVENATIRTVSNTEIDGESHQVDSRREKYQIYTLYLSSASVGLLIPWAAGWERTLLPTPKRLPARAMWALSPATTPPKAR